MKTVQLNWYQRVSLWSRVGVVETKNLREAAVYLRILDKIRPSDEEQAETEFQLNGNGQLQWRLPDRDYGTRVIDFEDEEAAALATGIEGQPCTVNDAVWIMPLLLKLRPHKESKAIDAEMTVSPV